ncbi:hypothetical protein ABW21_db0200809 [Orbilia brochopaga]|nr:hypothetical protein ABW21_db0200809 [Drechslerella brochopaga]
MRSTSIAVCGFGPRGRLFHNIYIAEQLALLWQGKYVDRTSRVHDYYEAQAEEEGPGAAFQYGCDAALNTGLEGPVPIEMKGLTPQQCKILDSLTDVSSRYSELIMANPDDTLKNLMGKNISTAALFLNAVDFESKDFNTKVPCGPRNLFGQALDAMTREANELARQHLPWLTIRIMHNKNVIKVDLTDPSRPFLTIEDTLSSVLFYRTYDLVIKTTGTTWTIPVSGLVRDNAYTGIPNADALTNYLSRQCLLDEHGVITPGSSILVGGTSLSAYDFIGLILAKTNIVRLETDGDTRELMIDEDEAKRYPDLIKLFNRKGGEVCAPRHADGMDVKMPEGFDFITPEMLLSVQMREGGDAPPIIFELTRIMTAIALNRCPASIEPDLSTEEQFKRMVSENEKYATNSHAITEAGMVRRCLISFFFSLSTTPNVAGQRALLLEKYPLLVREPWHASRSLLYNSTAPFDSQSSRNFWGHLMKSAPFAIHRVVTRLYELGVISWVQGAYEDVTWSLVSGFCLDGERAKGLIAPRTITETTDKLSTSILDQAMLPADGNAVYQKGRTLLSPSGETIHVMELGLPGHGGILDGILPRRRVQWFDTNNYESAQHLMPCVVGLVGLIESMVSRGVPKPFGLLKKYYRRILPRRRDFDRQCSKMKEPYHRLMDFLQYARLVESAYPRQFMEKMRKWIDLDGRQKIISDAKQMRDHHGILRKIWAAPNKKPEQQNFTPLSHDSFEQMTPDFSLEQIRKIKDLWSQECASTRVISYRVAHSNKLARPLRTGTKSDNIEQNFDHGILGLKKLEITTTAREIQEDDEDEDVYKIIVS